MSALLIPQTPPEKSPLLEDAGLVYLGLSHGNRTGIGSNVRKDTLPSQISDIVTPTGADRKNSDMEPNLRSSSGVVSGPRKEPPSVASDGVIPVVVAISEDEDEVHVQGSGVKVSTVLVKGLYTK